MRLIQVPGEFYELSKWLSQVEVGNKRKDGVFSANALVVCLRRSENSRARARHVFCESGRLLFGLQAEVTTQLCAFTTTLRYLSPGLQCMNLNVHARVLFSSKSHCHFCKGLKQAIFHIDLLFSLYFVSLGIRVRLLRRFNITLPNWNTALCKNHVPQLISFNFAMQQFNKTCLCIHKNMVYMKKNRTDTILTNLKVNVWYDHFYFSLELSSRVVSLRRVWE